MQKYNFLKMKSHGIFYKIIITFCVYCAASFNVLIWHLKSNASVIYKEDL